MHTFTAFQDAGTGTRVPAMKLRHTGVMGAPKSAGHTNEKPELYPGLRLLYLQGWCGVRMRDIGTCGRVPGFAEQNQANQVVELSGFCSDHNF